LTLVHPYEETNVLRRTVQLSIVVVAIAVPAGAFAQAAPAQYFAVCGSQPNLPTVYFSGVLHGPVTAFQNLSSGFTEYLQQHYAYKGTVGCVPAANAVIAQNFITARSTALRNAKKIVVETGWSQSVVPPVLGAAPAAAVKKALPPAPAATGAGPAAGGSAGGPSELTSLLSAVFGNGGCAGSGASSANPSGAKPGAAAGAAGCQNSLAQVSGALSSVFSTASNAPASGNAVPNNTQPGRIDGGLGSAQADSTKLVVYGCGRQDTQVACVNELTNQNQKNTLLQAGDVWKDAFIVDDRGDRHPRTAGFFLNIDGDQRAQLDISYGKTARFILMFDGVQTKVQKVALRSTSGGLDVEEINLVTADAGAAARK
jgi:hypothetical protein